MQSSCKSSCMNQHSHVLTVSLSRGRSVRSSEQRTFSAKRPPSKNRLGRAQRRICRPGSVLPSPNKQRLAQWIHHRSLHSRRRPSLLRRPYLDVPGNVHTSSPKLHHIMTLILDHCTPSCLSRVSHFWHLQSPDWPKEGVAVQLRRPRGNWPVSCEPQA